MGAALRDLEQFGFGPGFWMNEEVDPPLLDHENPDRTPIVRLHAQALAFLIALGLFVAAQLSLLDAAFRLQIDRVAIALACAGSVVAVIAAGLVGLLLSRKLVSPFGALDLPSRRETAGSSTKRRLAPFPRKDGEPPVPRDAGFFVGCREMRSDGTAI